SLGSDGQCRQHDHRRVALQEDLFHEVRDRVAQALVLLSAAALREPGPEVAGLARRRIHPALEEVALDVEDELVAGERGARGIGVRARGRRYVVVTAGLAPALRLRFLT